jgi:hypothetical protein
MSGFFRIDASSAAGMGGPTAGNPVTGASPPPTGIAQPQLTGALHESHVSQQPFLPQCQWANHCLDFLHFGWQQTGLVQESVQDGAGVVQPQ